MTFDDLADAVIRNRFQESNRTDVKLWLNASYTAIWQEADWYFKHVTAAPWTVTAGDDAPAMFSDFAEAEGVFNENGEPLIYLPQKQLEDNYLGDDGSGSSEAYTVVGREIILAPTPATTRTYYLSYRRRISHVDVGGSAAAGVMSEDGDQPIWGAEFDYLLVADAQLTGELLHKDPQAAQTQVVRDRMLDSLKRDSLHSMQSSEPVFWGAC
jgi:hypothetical protein